MRWRLSLVDALRRHGLSDPEVAIRIVDRLQRHEATGKLKRFIPLALAAVAHSAAKPLHRIKKSARKPSWGIPGAV